MMRRKLQLLIYSFLARHRIFHYLLFKILKSKDFLDKSFDKIISDYSKKNKDFFFIQIGANDGLKADPIYLYVRKYGWKGILVEPVNYIFKKLKKNYKGVPNIYLENVAIADKEGYKNFYRLKKISGENYPLWYDEIGSFLKENVLKHKDKFPDLENYLMVEKIKCLTLKSLFKKYQLKKIDFLQIDVEGYDYHIVKQIPFDKIKPKIIRYEDRHLPKEQQEYCKNLLIKNGYKILQITGDTLAYLKDSH
ncbi:FkbM family methyltransferase [Candidatus Pacearchaeota archaeon]|nr:FkbM family methyltransferase [Candidatus Pacearchaeota archaeon]